MATAGGFIAAAVALIQSRRLARAQNFFTLAQFLQANDVREARRRIFDLEDTNTLPERWSPDDASKEARDAASLVASSYDLTGRVVALGYVDYEPFLDDWGPSIKKSETALASFLTERRDPHGDRYLDDFTRLARSVESWEKSRYAPRPLRRLAFRRELRRRLREERRG